MKWIIDIMPYISWIVVIGILFSPSSKTKKIKELERRVEELERTI